MALRFFNTLTRRLEEFVPLKEGRVGMYTCGPTVHDFAHIGNFRTYVFEDLLRRYLRYRGYQVFQVMNITDVEDKILRKAREEGRTIREITEPFTRAFFEDLDRLNIERAEVYPRATQHVDEMVKLVRCLLEKGLAYRSEDGSVYFDISRFPDYGRLARIQAGKLKSGVRVSHDEYDKEDAADFALWKAWSPDDGEVYWEGYPDLGKGRPGWHLECSAMSTRYLGDHFDIHTGGVDNIFPHHDNEIAQTEGCTGRKFVNYWLHSEHLKVEGRKMAKSLGNFYTLRDLLDPRANESGKAWDPMAVRYLLLSAHYRSRLNFTFTGLEDAARALERLRNLVRRLRGQRGEEPLLPAVQRALDEGRRGFEEAMDEDLNTPRALAAVHELVRRIHQAIDKAGDLGRESARSVLDLLFDLDRVLGLRLREAGEAELPPEALRLIEERDQARRRRDYSRADALREELRERWGVVVEDTPQGVRWKATGRT